LGGFFVLHDSVMVIKDHLRGKALPLVDRKVAQAYSLAAQPKEGTSVVWFSAVLSLLIAFASPPVRPGRQLDLAFRSAVVQQPTPTLTNDDILHLTAAGISADIIVAKIKASKCHFDTSPAELIALRGKSIPDAVILAMVQAVNSESSGRPVSAETSALEAVKEPFRLPTLSREILDERAHRDSICPACKFILISYVDSKTGAVTDDWVSKDQLNWLKTVSKEIEKGKRQTKFLITKQRENADYILFWTQAQGFIPYVTYVPRTETTTSKVSGTYSTIETSGYGFGTITGNIVVTRTYYEAQSNEWQFVDASLTVFDKSGKNVYETKHRGNWRWSKPEKDCLEDALKYLRQLRE
jgi:hypothetical protein